LAIGFENVRRGELGSIVILVHHDSGSNLPKITQTLRNLGMRFGPRNRRKEQTGQNRDDRDHDQQFDEGESFWSSKAVRPGLHWVVVRIRVPASHVPNDAEVLFHSALSFWDIAAR
jgi:hypothetical protein